MVRVILYANKIVVRMLANVQIISMLILIVQNVQKPVVVHVLNLLKKHVVYHLSVLMQVMHAPVILLNT